jgi:hypothetical protein
MMAPTMSPSPQLIQGHHHHRLFSGIGPPGQPLDELLGEPVIGQHVSGHQDEDHLHGKGEQIPEPAVPVVDHLDGPLPRDEDAHQIGDEGEDNGEQERVGHPLLDIFGDVEPDFLQKTLFRRCLVHGCFLLRKSNRC